MNIVDQQSINQLLEIKDNPVVTIYMPTHRAPTPPHVQEDIIRFKNSIRTAKEQLAAAGTDEATTHEIIRKLEQLLSQDDFWLQASEGLALFATNNSLTYFYLPLECDEYAEVGTTANITPLLALVSYDQPYYLLALAVHQPVLYKGNMYGLEKVDIDFPASPEDALNIDEMFSNSHTQRGRAALGGGDIRMGTHGQGDSRGAGTEERLTYFRMIDSKIKTSKELDQSLPLLLAGTDDEVTKYRTNSDYKHILETRINGNYTEANLRDLHTIAWPLVQAECHGKQQASLVESFLEGEGIGKSSSDMTEIKQAIDRGRVDALMLEIITSTRDSVSDTKEAITKLTLPTPSEMVAIMNTLAIATYRQGGKIVALMQQTMPAKVAMAAVYRY